MGRYAEARGYLLESLAIARAIGDKRRIAAVLQPLGLAFQGLGDLPAARIYLEEALALAQKLGNKRDVAAAVNALAQLFRLEGNLHAAEPLYEDLLAFGRDLGDRELIAIGLLNLSMVSIGKRSGDRAQEMLCQALGIAKEIGSKPAGQSVLEVSAGLSALREDWQRAALFFGAAEAQAEHTGLHRDPADEAFLTPLIGKARRALGAAYAVAEADGRALSYEQAMLELHSWLERCR
jgi:tetratricopeptide (TPR) repeat protein